MKKYRLKTEAVPFFKDKFATSVHDFEVWKKLGVDDKALEEIPEAYISYGHERNTSDDVKYTSLSGWDKSEQTVFILQKNYQLPVKIGGILDTLESGAEFKKDAYGYIHSSGIRFPATFVENNLEWFLPKENKTTLIKQRLHVTQEHETKNILYLIQMLKSFVDENTIIVNCSPDYSSIGSQILSHQLSKSYPLKVYPLEMPYPNEEWNIEQSMEQIKYIVFNRQEKIIFFDSGCIRGKNYTLLNNYITSRIAKENMGRFYFTALFENIHSEFKCGFVSEFYNAKDKELHFWWETETNPAWL